MSGHCVYWNCVTVRSELRPLWRPCGRSTVAREAWQTAGQTAGRTAHLPVMEVSEGEGPLGVVGEDAAAPWRHQETAVRLWRRGRPVLLTLPLRRRDKDSGARVTRQRNGGA